MMNYLIILAILLVLIALRLTKFIAVAVVVALLVILLAKNGIRLFPGSKRKDDRKT